MDPPPYPGAPRWARWFGLAALLLVALFVILHLTGNAPMGMSHG
jgi:thiosulfate reductase cytochrome b subunit